MGAKNMLYRRQFHLNQNMKELKMAEAKGLNKPVKLKKEMAEF